MKNNVEFVKKNNICISCGICNGVCPKKCITYKKQGGQYLPDVDNLSCINCGLCKKCCPALNKKYEKDISIDKLLIGKYLKCYVGYYKNPEMRSESTSGGIVMGLVNRLLKSDMYDCAFLVDSFKLNDFIENKKVVYDDLNFSFHKSRYVSISNEKLINYIIHNKDEKVIIVAVGCVIQGILNVISKFKLNRDNYLLIGLFCDKSLSYNIFNYFDNISDFKSDLEELVFRTKESGGWPGNVKLISGNNKVQFMNSSERGLVKDYFQLEGCTYCLDKFNLYSDITLGDNYTNYFSDNLGSNSVIIRTKKGMEIFKEFKNYFELKDIEIEKISKSQKIKNKLLNLKNSKILYNNKGVNIYPEIINKIDVNRDDIKKYNKIIKKNNIGRNYSKTKNKLIFIVFIKKIRLKLIKIIGGCK